MTLKRLAIIGGIVAIGLILSFSLMRATGWDNTILFPVTRVVREGLSPAQKGIEEIKDNINSFFSYFSNNKKLQTENEELKKRIAVLEEKAYALKEQEMENKRLNELLNYKQEKTANYDFALAKVIGRDPGNWYQTITINRGSSAGLQKNMAVVTHDGLVGIINSTTANTSEVLLIIDAESAVGARILENRVTPGIAVGTGKSDHMQMILLPHDAPLERGQTIVTSGLGGLYPEGIRIGMVNEVMLEPNGLIKNAQIEPFVDFDRLEEVFVILQILKNETADTAAGEETTVLEQEKQR